MDKPRFDQMLGGPVSLPPRLHMMKFAAARAKEIQVMKTMLGTQTGTKLAFQRIPKHMRRRAMSHNAKRLPRRLREIHLSQMRKSGMPPQPKRPSRRYRRRPRNLLEDYMRRQMRCQWLRTHLWHAKRFHMVNKWGYRLPDCPCDKAFRACYRASAKHCLMQDISYYQCIELVGDFNRIVDGFKRVTDSNAGLSVGARAFRGGLREGKITLFGLDEPKRAVGCLYFNWNAPSVADDENVLRQLWLWIHVACYQDVLDTLISCFSLKKTKPSCYHSDLISNIQLFERYSDLNRIRLTGPLANSVVHDTFKLVTAVDTNNYKSTWFSEYISSDTNKTTLLKQIECWDQLSKVTSTGALPPHTLFPFLVEDPRFNLPAKRTKSQPIKYKPDDGICWNQPPEGIASTPIWDETYRYSVKISKLSNAQINELRSNMLVPESGMEKGTPVPVVLVQRPGNAMGYGSGWDLIVPADYTQPIWVSLILRGARAGGLRESTSVNFEMGLADILSPDTRAGASDEFYLAKASKETFFKKPPNKRVNYNKFAIASPFEFNWNMLVEEWRRLAATEGHWSVIRDRRKLSLIQDFVKSKVVSAALPDCASNSLIPVKLTCPKGALAQFAIICLPLNADDLKQEPVEPRIVDKLQQERKELRRKHLGLLKKLRKKRIEAKKANKVLNNVDSNMLVEVMKKMRSLWLPLPTTIRKSCSREVIGFVKMGGFSFTLAKSSAVGYIASGALSALRELRIKNKVLVRNTNTRQYRIAELDIIVE